MRTKDHLLLGRHLLGLSDCPGLHKHRRAFLLGCVEPDYNSATYLRGLVSHRMLRGHNAENSLAHMTRCLESFREEGLRTTWDYFTLGTLLHYVADAFTWPHNQFWTGSLLEHAVYERQLHLLFPGVLHAQTKIPAAPPGSLLEYFSRCHEAYAAAPRRMETDCRYILEVCGAMLLGCERYAIALDAEWFVRVPDFEGA